jgi:hypothetical protein
MENTQTIALLGDSGEGKHLITDFDDHSDANSSQAKEA